MRGLLVIFTLLPTLIFAQRMDPYAVTNPRPKEDPPGTVKQGVIKVRREPLRPYFKCEYYLTLASVVEREIEVDHPAPSYQGEKLRKLQPFFDSSAYPEKFKRVYPTKMTNFSKIFEDQIQYSYPFTDTASIDTMAVDMWIGKNGKIRWKEVDTTYASHMPRALELELYMAVNQLTDWGQGGGCSAPKKFLRKQKPISESYYCRLYIIVSSKPITPQQRSTGARSATMDMPLNQPEDPEEEVPNEKRGNK